METNTATNTTNNADMYKLEKILNNLEKFHKNIDFDNPAKMFSYIQFPISKNKQLFCVDKIGILVDKIKTNNSKPIYYNLEKKIINKIKRNNQKVMLISYTIKYNNKICKQLGIIFKDETSDNKQITSGKNNLDLIYNFYLPINTSLINNNNNNDQTDVNTIRLWDIKLTEILDKINKKNLPNLDEEIYAINYIKHNLDLFFENNIFNNNFSEIIGLISMIISYVKIDTDLSSIKTSFGELIAGGGDEDVENENTFIKLSENIKEKLATGNETLEKYFEIVNGELRLKKAEKAEKTNKTNKTNKTEKINKAEKEGENNKEDNERKPSEYALINSIGVAGTIDGSEIAIAPYINNVIKK